MCQSGIQLLLQHVRLLLDCHGQLLLQHIHLSLDGHGQLLLQHICLPLDIRSQLLLQHIRLPLDGHGIQISLENLIRAPTVSTSTPATPSADAPQQLTASALAASTSWMPSLVLVASVHPQATIFLSSFLALTAELFVLATDPFL